MVTKNKKKQLWNTTKGKNIEIKNFTAKINKTQNNIVMWEMKEKKKAIRYTENKQKMIKGSPSLSIII